MEFTQIDPNAFHSLGKGSKPLVIRVHINNFEETHPYKKIFIKEKKTVNKRSRSKSAAKRRPNSIKMFENAHTTNQNETFLINSKKLKESSNSKTIILRASLKQSERKSRIHGNGNAVSQSHNIQRGKLSKVSKVEEHQMRNIIQKAKQSKKSKNGSPKDLLTELSKVIYGEQYGLFQDRSFEFVDQSSIHGEQNCLFFDLESKEQVL